MKSSDAFDSRDRSVTIAYQNDLMSRGPLGQLAFGLFRAQKRSARAKDYRRALRSQSYKAKNEALKYVDAVLTAVESEIVMGFSLTWGWQKDPNQAMHNKVLYVEFEFGQCSFHSDRTFSDKQFPGQWDGKGNSESTILELCDRVIATEKPRPFTDRDLTPFGKHVGDPLSEFDEGYIEWLSRWDGLKEWAAVEEYVRSKATNPAASQPRV